MKSKNHLHRRDFIELTFAGSLALFGQSCRNTEVKQMTSDSQTNARQTPRIRYDIASPEAGAKRSIENLNTVVGIMKKLPESNYCSWIAQAKIHKCFCPHRKSIFLPWHRAYLFYFEEICRKLLKESGVKDYDDFALPYWDWSNPPHKMPEIFLKDSLQNDIPPPSGWINGPFDHTRKNKPNDIPDLNLVGMNNINQILKKDFYGIIYGPGTTGQLESGPHNHIHTVFIRGNMGVPEAAALDPVFWVHHSNIDRLWLNWMKKHTTGTPAPETPAPNCQMDCVGKNPPDIHEWLLSKVGIFFDAAGNPVELQVCSLLDTFDANVFGGGYRYEDDPNPINFSDCVIMPETKVRGYSIKGLVGDGKTAKINGSVTVKVSNFTTIPETLNNALNALITKLKLTSTASFPALLLTVEVEKPANPQFSVTVFINAPGNPAKLPVSTSAYVATFNFFESIGEAHRHGGEGMNMNVESRKFTFDVTDTILKLSESKLFTLEKATVSLAPKPIPGEKYSEKDVVRLISFEFDLVGYTGEIVK